MKKKLIFSLTLILFWFLWNLAIASANNHSKCKIFLQCLILLLIILQCLYVMKFNLFAVNGCKWADQLVVSTVNGCLGWADQLIVSTVNGCLGLADQLVVSTVNGCLGLADQLRTPPNRPGVRWCTPLLTGTEPHTVTNKVHGFKQFLTNLYYVHKIFYQHL